jgi:hypothetical protein
MAKMVYEWRGNMKPENESSKQPEKEAVVTTIVGGRPPGAGTKVGRIPRGIEILVKKASVDPAFKALLLDKRGEAAKEIELQLDPTETAMLNQIPAAQLLAIIESTKIRPETRRVFLGRVAALMLTALGGALFNCSSNEKGNDTIKDEKNNTFPQTEGIRPDRPPAVRDSSGVDTTNTDSNQAAKPPHIDSQQMISKGNRPDRPPAVRDSANADTTGIDSTTIISNQ